MKKSIIVIGLVLVSGLAFGQKKSKKVKQQPVVETKAPAVKPVVYKVEFTDDGLRQIMAKSDSMINRLLISEMRMKDGIPIVNWLQQVELTFRQSRETQKAKIDSAEKAKTDSLAKVKK